MSSKASGAVAERYATALLQLAEERSVLDAVTSDLKSLQGMLRESSDLRRLIRNPVVGRAAQSRALVALAEQASFSQLTRNFVGLLAVNGRISALSAIIDAYVTALARKRGEIKARLTSAIPLDGGRVEAVVQAIRKAINQNVLLDFDVDPSLLGGFTVQFGSRMVDASIKTQLQHLTFALKGDG